MEINYNIVSLIDFLGLIQGVLFGILLIFGNRKSRPSLFLGLFLITYTIEMIEPILTDTNILPQKPELLFLPLSFYYLSVPLFYLYAKSLTASFSLKKHWPILIPGIIEFLIFTILFFQPTAQKLSLIENEIFNFFFRIFIYASLIYSIFFAIQTIRLVNRHQEKVLNYFSNIEKQQLKWVKAVAIFIMVFYSLWFIPILLPDDIMQNIAYPIFGAINVIFIYWVGISGLRQPKVEMQFEPSIKEAPQKELEPIQEKESDETYQKLLNWMEEKQLFKDSDLTLPALAEQLKITRRNLSQIINQKTQANFNQFVNHYRVEEAKKVLIDPKFDHLNMLGVAFEVGFNSKATFFSVFKKMEGSSPGNYKKEHSV